MSASRIILALSYPCVKNFQNWWKSDEVMTITILHSFLRHGVQLFHHRMVTHKKRRQTQNLTKRTIQANNRKLWCFTNCCYSQQTLFQVCHLAEWAHKADCFLKVCSF